MMGPDLFSDHGAKKGCPFCLARNDRSDLLKENEELFLLKGPLAGLSAIVCEPDSSVSEFALVRLKEQSDGSMYRIRRGQDLFLRQPAPSIPFWICQLSLKNLNKIEDAMLRGVWRVFNSSERIEPEVEMARVLAAAAWNSRLPVNGTDLWPTLAAHGFHSELQSKFSSFVRIWTVSACFNWGA